MLTITKRNGIYAVKNGENTLGQGRFLESALRNAVENNAAGTYPEEFFFHAAEILTPLVRESGGQIATGGVSA